MSYPRFSRGEISAMLAKCQLAVVSEADLIHPYSDKICNLYDQISAHIGTFQEGHGQIEFGALEQLENPDNHVQSVQVMNLYKKIHQLVAATNCPITFTPKDLIMPEAERTELFLSALLNFHIYRLTKLNQLKLYGYDLDLFENRKEVAQNRIQELKAAIAKFEELRERELPLVGELICKVKELKQTVPEHYKRQMELRTQINQVKEKAKEMDGKISNAEFALVQSGEENDRLHSKIVRSPDKLQRALEEKKMAQIETKNAERAAVQSFQDKTVTLEAYAKACKKMSKHFAQMQALQEQVDSAKIVDKEAKVLNNKLSDEGVLIKSLEVKLVELQSKADQLKEFKKQLEKEKALSLEDVDKELKKVKSEVDSRRIALQSRQTHIDVMVTEADAITSKRRTVKEEAEAKTQELDRKYEEILAEFENYSKSISNLLPVTDVDKGPVRQK